MPTSILRSSQIQPVKCTMDGRGRGPRIHWMSIWRFASNQKKNLTERQLLVFPWRAHNQMLSWKLVPSSTCLGMPLNQVDAQDYCSVRPFLYPLSPLHSTAWKQHLSFRKISSSTTQKIITKAYVPSVDEELVIALLHTPKTMNDY